MDLAWNPDCDDCTTGADPKPKDPEFTGANVNIFAGVEDEALVTAGLDAVEAVEAVVAGAAEAVLRLSDVKIWSPSLIPSDSREL